MLQVITRLAIAAPRRIVGIAFLVLVGAAVFGLPVVNSLSGGGFQDPTSESARATEVLRDRFNQTDQQMLIVVTAPDGVRSESARRVATDIVDQLKRSPWVLNVSSAWTMPPDRPQAASLISKDNKSGMIVAGLKGGENDAQKYASTLTSDLVHDRDGVTVRAGGMAVAYAQINGQNQRDLLLMESIAIPLSFAVLVWVLGGVVAATLPIVLGLLAIVGTMSVLRLISFATDVSTYALDLSIAMGLALAIDYNLLIITRYREELARTEDRDRALYRTMATAGRTVLFSATTVGLSIGGDGAVPDVLSEIVRLHHRGHSDHRGDRRGGGHPGGDRAAGAPAARAGRPTGAAPHPARTAVVSRPRAPATRGPVLVPVDPVRAAPRHPDRPERRGAAAIAGRAVLGGEVGLPGRARAARIRVGAPGRRHAGQRLRERVRHRGVRRRARRPRRDPRRAAAVRRRPVARARRVFGQRTGRDVRRGESGGAARRPTGVANGSAFLTVSTTAPLYSQASNTQLDRLHQVAGPGGRAVQMTGLAQINRDSVDAITQRLPIVFALIALITFALLFLLTGSAVLPVQALVCNVLSLTAAFGAMVWIFQDGHLGALGTTPNGTLNANIPVLLFCIAFGLAMDYEVFLVSRIHEYWLASQAMRETPPTAAEARAATDESAALGIAGIGRVVTTAAVVMSISFAALIPAHVSFMRMLGLGLTLGVLVDATLVRMVLVPAFIHLLGRWTWWAPRPLVSLRERSAIGEDGEIAVGRGRWARDAPDAGRALIRRWPTKATTGRG
ncbi:MMPL family protein [Mycobacterium intracellulare 1956]|uniref:MMPL family protein n=1 Tax=Mycobacterium intracellulare 1956 TaxID=1299331 RepID=X8CQF8_MYCIT|nr:MMPL family protein [Mycobacterium intracellulare 1956]